MLATAVTVTSVSGAAAGAAYEERHSPKKRERLLACGSPSSPQPASPSSLSPPLLPLSPGVHICLMGPGDLQRNCTVHEHCCSPNCPSGNWPVHSDEGAADATTVSITESGESSFTRLRPTGLINLLPAKQKFCLNGKRHVQPSLLLKLFTETHFTLKKRKFNVNCDPRMNNNNNKKKIVR